MLPYVTGEHAGIGVESASRRSRHDQANRLTLVKILCRYNAAPTSGRQRYQRPKCAPKKFLPHVIPSFFPDTAAISIGDSGKHSTYFQLTQAFLYQIHTRNFPTKIVVRAHQGERDFFALPEQVSL
jgi:hypothetical protein